MPSYYSTQSKLRGGYYDVLNCYGVTTMLGSVKTESLNLRGHLNGNYNLFARSLRGTGALRVAKLQCNTAVWYGSSSVRCFMQVGKFLALYGNFIGEGGIVCPVVKMDGSIIYNGRITASEITARGEISLGTFEAADIRIEISRASRCTSVFGKRVVVTHRIPTVFERLFLPPQVTQHMILTVATGIEGEYVSLENVIADRVSGNDVIIGPGCRINRVFYRDHIYIDENAYVEWYEPLPDTPGGNPEGRRPE
ncbi:MAG: hypothetical protein J6Y67_01745 [Lachnospiraceae bacterium]|nr:hypothetical protein [Lachnospiraceae bacterium]